MTGWSFVVAAVVFTLGWVLGRRETSALDEQLDDERARADQMADLLESVDVYDPTEVLAAHRAARAKAAAE